MIFSSVSSIKKKEKKRDFAAIVCFKRVYFWRFLAAWTSGAFRVPKIFEES